MKLLKALHFLLVLTVVSLQAQNKRPVTIDDYFKLKDVRDPRISPDGKWVAYTVSTKDLEEDESETRVWMISSNGGEAIPMTAKGYSASRPRWSPDGKYLSFLAKRGEDEDEKSQVWTLNRQGGEAQQLTEIKQGVSGYEWSPDGSRLLLLIKDPKPELLTEDKEDDDKPKPFVIDRLQFKRDYIGYLDRLRTHLYVFTPGDSAAVQITSGDYDDTQPAWSPDGKSIAFVSNRSENPDGNRDTNIWIVSADNTDKGHNLTQITKNPQEDNSPAWSPDGNNITYTTVTAEPKAIWYATNHLATISAKGGDPTVLTERLDRNIGNPRYSPDGKRIWFLLEDSGERQLASIATNGKNLRRAVSGELSVRGYDMVGNMFTPLLSRFHEPLEVYKFQDNQLTQLTVENKELLKQLERAEMNNVQYQSSGGTEVEAFITKPLGFDPSMKYPVILWIHGGPVSQYEFNFRFWPHLYAANGYVVIQANPRGSSGYGQAFSEALFADWGNPDYDDVMAGIDYVIEQGYGDPDRLGVGGWSYGGILTNYVITKTDRFKGAVSGASEALYRSNYGHDHYQMWWELELGLPWENPEAWERISPFNDVHKITTPTLWIGGALDWNVPILNSEQMYQAMKRLGRETQLVVYPGEHHGIRKPSFQKDRFERFLGWYDKYVKGVD